MTGSKCLLDTSVIIQAFRKDNTIVDRLDEFTEVFVPVIVIGELLYGAHRSTNPIRNIEQVLHFIERCTIAAMDTEVAMHNGKIKAELHEKGKPIPENDIWIAAMAQRYKLPLFTTDSHFKEIKSLLVL